MIGTSNVDRWIGHWSWGHPQHQIHPNPQIVWRFQQCGVSSESENDRTGFVHISPSIRCWPCTRCLLHFTSPWPDTAFRGNVKAPFKGNPNNRRVISPYQWWSMAYGAQYHVVVVVSPIVELFWPSGFLSRRSLVISTRVLDRSNQGMMVPCSGAGAGWIALQEGYSAISSSDC